MGKSPTPNVFRKEYHYEEIEETAEPLRRQSPDYGRYGYPSYNMNPYQAYQPRYESRQYSMTEELTSPNGEKVRRTITVHESSYGSVTTSYRQEEKPHRSWYQKIIDRYNG